MKVRRLLLGVGIAIPALFVAFRFLVGIQTYEFPCGFAGHAVVMFNHPNGVPLKRGLLGGYQLVVAQSGILRVRDKAPNEPFFQINVIETCDVEKCS